ncbi:MAG: phosphopentomutase [Clostridia bacterium]|nr:phosphopentomutase [Clostridia bacterium]
MRRVILVVMDSAGIGALPDAKQFNDEGVNTFTHVFQANNGLAIPNLLKLGLGNIEGNKALGTCDHPIGAYGRMAEKSCGKDTTVGHWEMSGVITKIPFRTNPKGMPEDFIKEFVEKAGLEGVIGNVAGSGTEIMKEYGEEHLRTGYPIVYVSPVDSNFQILAHEETFGLERLYQICEVARGMLKGEREVSRVIARPFVGENKDSFNRTSNRRDYSVPPTGKTMLDVIKSAGQHVAAVGKIEDIFCKIGVTDAVHTKGNMDGVDKTLDYMKTIEDGLIFTNLVDFDMLYGHRNDFVGYGKALEELDKRIPELMAELKEEDILIFTADHGCDPTTPGCDHTREYVPVLCYGKNVKEGVELGTRSCFADLAETILEYLGLEKIGTGKSFLREIEK